MATKNDDYIYIPFHAFITKEEFEHLNFGKIYFSSIQMAFIAILKHLNDKKLLELDLPEFQYEKNQFDGIFSAELEEIVDYELWIFNFYDDVFCTKTNYGTELDLFNLIAGYYPPNISQICVSSKYADAVPKALLNQLHQSIEFAIIEWMDNVSAAIRDDAISCAICQHDGELTHLDSNLFGNSLFVHHLGKVLELRIVNGKPEYFDIGALFIFEDGDLLKASQEDTSKLEDWIKQQYLLFPLTPPSVQGKASNKDNFIKYALDILTDKSLPENKQLRIKTIDVKRAWKKVLPSDCPWTFSGKKKEKEAN